MIREPPHFSNFETADMWHRVLVEAPYRRQVALGYIRDFHYGSVPSRAMDGAILVSVLSTAPPNQVLG